MIEEKYIEIVKNCENNHPNILGIGKIKRIEENKDLIFICQTCKDEIICKQDEIKKKMYFFSKKALNRFRFKNKAAWTDEKS